MRRGEIWNVTIPIGDRVRPVVILTNDHANEDGDDRPHAADIMEFAHESPYAVRLAEWVCAAQRSAPSRYGDEERDAGEHAGRPEPHPRRERLPVRADRDQQEHRRHREQL